MKTILALIDFSDVSAKILEQAQALAQAFKSDVVLIHVVPPEPLVVDFAPPAVPPDLFLTRQQELFAMRDTLISQGINTTAQVLGGLLEETLLEQIGLSNPDVILLGSHGHGALYHLLIGSVTASIIKHAGRPVLIIPSVPVPETHLVKAAIKKAREAKTDPLIEVPEGIPTFI